MISTVILFIWPRKCCFGDTFIIHRDIDEANCYIFNKYKQWVLICSNCFGLAWPPSTKFEPVNLESNQTFINCFFFVNRNFNIRMKKKKIRKIQWMKTLKWAKNNNFYEFYAISFNKNAQFGFHSPQSLQTDLKLIKEFLVGWDGVDRQQQTLTLRRIQPKNLEEQVNKEVKKVSYLDKLLLYC